MTVGVETWTPETPIVELARLLGERRDLEIHAERRGMNSSRGAYIQSACEIIIRATFVHPSFVI